MNNDNDRKLTPPDAFGPNVPHRADGGWPEDSGAPPLPLEKGWDPFVSSPQMEHK